MDQSRALEIFSLSQRRLCAYKRALTVMDYDGMTCAPANSASVRADTSAVLARDMLRLTLNTDRAASIEVLSRESTGLSPALRREVSLAARNLERLSRVPEELYARHRLVAAEAFAVWREAKARSDFGMLAPYLERVFRSAAGLASHAAPGCDPYEYLIDENEEGMTRQALDEFFLQIKKCLAPLIKSASGLPLAEKGFLYGHFPAEAQRAFSFELLELMGIDKSSCTLSEAEHPYTTVAGLRDVRISTHYYENCATANMFSILHEGGHALYALGLSPELEGTSLCFAASAGMNESQSRFYENVIGRSPAFARLVLPMLRRRFPGAFDGISADMLHTAFTRAEPTLKRTEADELTYSMHVLIRYELEKALMDGSVSVYDIPREWNRLYGLYLGVDVPCDREGCLQDMHWSSGLIGYFPTYALGNAYGAQLYHTLRKELDIDALVENGDIPSVTSCLRERIHRHGMLMPPSELLRLACGEEFDPAYYVDYLKERYGGLSGA